jgi:O-acetyl-ADP-ribose deacetylase (regulator of RNase III)
LSHELQHDLPGGRVTMVAGDLTAQNVDAIVNAANSTLLGGGGVDGAIHYAGGPAILEACRVIRHSQYPNGLPTGEAVITTGGNLTARFVIHTVGPIYGQEGGAEAELLASCYRNCLSLAAEHGLNSIAFPAISTGAFGYPLLDAGRIAGATIAAFLREAEKPRTVRLVSFTEWMLNQLLGDRPFLDNFTAIS